MLEVGSTPLNAHLNALYEAGAHALRGVCWHFTHVLLDTETQLLRATGLVTVDAVLAGPPKPVVQQVESAPMRTPLLTATSSVAWRSCVLLPVHRATASRFLP